MQAPRADERGAFIFYLTPSPSPNALGEGRKPAEKNLKKCPGGLTKEGQKHYNKTMREYPSEEKDGRFRAWRNKLALVSVAPSTFSVRADEERAANQRHSFIRKEGVMLKLFVLAVCAGMMWGCGKKSSTGPTTPAESIEVISMQGYWAYPIQTYQSPTYTTIRGAWVRFNAPSTKSCVFDSLLVVFPDSLGNTMFCKRAGGWSIFLAGGESGDLGEFAICEPGGMGCYTSNLAGHGQYRLKVWATWDGAAHESAVYSWMW